MSKLQEIKAAQLQSRKNRDARTVTLLTTIIGEAEMVGKSAGNRESTDAEVLQVLKKFEKGMIENINLYRERGLITHAQLAEFELSVLQEFLPAKLTDGQVKADIEQMLVEHSIALEQKSMGQLTPLMKEKYGEQFDGRQVSTIFKSML